MTKDDSFSLTPPSKELSPAKTAMQEYMAENNPKPAIRKSAVQTYGQPAPQPPEPTKRISVDLPESLHLRVRMGCLTEGVFLSDEVRRLLDRRFPDL